MPRDEFIPKAQLLSYQCRSLSDVAAERIGPCSHSTLQLTTIEQREGAGLSATWEWGMKGANRAQYGLMR